MNQEQRAVEIFLDRTLPKLSMCACLGPRALPGQPVCNGANWDEIKREPVCPCSMHNVVNVDEQYYAVDPTAHTAKLLGPVGGPYI